MQKIIALSTALMLVGCATVQNGLDVVSDGVIKVGGGIEKAISKKKCTKSKNGDESYFSVTPVTVLQGGTVTVIACYPVNTAGTVKVRERRFITGPDGRVDILKDERVKRHNGYWQSKFDFVVPVSIPPGNYVVTQRITYQGLKFERKKKIIIYKKRT
ncbi:MAG: hypothetical protein ACRBHB_21995 [Arenicella sp.]